MGPPAVHRRLDFQLSIRDVKGDATVDMSHFRVHKIQDNKAVVSLIKNINSTAEIQLQLEMKIYSREFRADKQEICFVTAGAIFNVFVTEDPW